MLTLIRGPASVLTWPLSCISVVRAENDKTRWPAVDPSLTRKDFFEPAMSGD